MNMAGLSYGVPYAKSSNYLYYSSDWWSLSPYSSDIYPRVFQGHNGNFVNFYASYSKAVVPVINLKKDVTISSGNGSTSSPFVVN